MEGREGHRGGRGMKAKREMVRDVIVKRESGRDEWKR